MRQIADRCPVPGHDQIKCGLVGNGDGARWFPFEETFSSTPFVKPVIVRRKLEGCIGCVPRTPVFFDRPLGDCFFHVLVERGRMFTADAEDLENLEHVHFIRGHNRMP